MVCLSPSKCRIVAFSRGHRSPDISVNLDNIRIPNSESVKFLGVILHRKLNWKLHIEHLIVKCEKSINVLRAICRVWWGSHPSTMNLLYNALVKSHLDFGCQLMGPLPKYLETKLQRVQSKCLRLILGAMKSSPVVSLQVECVEMPLDLRRLLLCHKFILKRHNNSKHPLLSKLDTLTELTLQKTSNTRDRSDLMPPLCIANQFVKALNIYPSKRDVLPMFSIPFEAITFRPNVIDFIGLDRACSNWDKGVVQKTFQSEIDQRWPGFTRIFTDGSKSENGKCGAAFCIPSLKIEKKYKLSGGSSVYSSECVALTEALREILKRSISKSTIFTDSLSLVQKIICNNTDDPYDDLFWTIKDLLFEISGNDFQLFIVWIPAHVGIEGNERVDRLAKEASDDGLVPKTYRPSVNESLVDVEREIKREWSNAWMSSDRGAYYRGIQRCIPNAPWFSGIKLPKLDISILCRLRIGHCSVASHLYRLGIIESPMCVCGDAEETVDHVFFDCPLLDRKKFVTSIGKSCVTFPVNVQFLLSLGDSRVNSHILRFLKDNERLL